MQRRFRRLAVGLASLLVLGACGGGSSNAEKQVQDVVRGFNRAEHAKDGKTFVTYFTDKGLEAWGSGSREEIAAGHSDVGEDRVDIVGFPATKVSGDRAIVTVDAKSGIAVFRVKFPMVRQGGRWLVNGQQFIGSPPAPKGTKIFDVKAAEYRYEFNAAHVSSPRFEIRFRNTGKEQHEITLFRFPAGTSVDEARTALQGVHGDKLDNVPAPYQLVGHVTFAEPGKTENTLLSRALGAGHYAFVCFIPEGGVTDHGPINPNGRPHIQLGMIADFTVK